MRIKITFEPLAGVLELPPNYNHMLQGIIYRHLEGRLAARIHDGGLRYGKRTYKMFTFSRLRGDNVVYDRKRKLLVFTGKVWFHLGSLDNELLESFTTTMLRREIVNFTGEQTARVSAVEVEMPITPVRPAIVSMMSPLTVYSTLQTPDNRKKTYYYSPWEDEFSTLIMDNLKRRMAALLGGDEELPPLNGAYIRPVRVTKKDFVITKFKNIVIKAWKGRYELNLPPPYFELAYNAGLGSKNSQGFGMFRVIKGQSPDDSG